MNLRKRLIQFKFTLERGYAWVKLPTLAVMGSGIIKPYFPNWSFTQLSIVAFLVFITVGFLDLKLKLLHEELSYSTSKNPVMMKGLYGEKK